MNFPSIKKHFDTLLQRLFAIQQKDDALQQKANQIFTTAIQQKEQADLTNIHKTIDTL